MSGSCSAQLPLKQRIKLLDDEDTELPVQYYWMTLGMIALVVAVPLIYRYLWLFLWDIVSGVREDLALPKAPKGCRQIGKQAVRNLSEQKFTGEYQALPRHKTFPKASAEDLENTTSAEYANTGLEGRIEALYLHPVKSTPPIEVDSVSITDSGLKYDRLFSFAQLASQLPDSDGKVEHTWKIITQRESAQLALLETELWIPDPELDDFDEDDLWVQNGGCLVIRFPFVPDFEMNRQGIRDTLSQFLLKRRRNRKSPGKTLEIRLPLVPCKERVKEKNYPSQNLVVWKEFPNVWDMSCEADHETLSKLGYSLGISNPFTIFRIHDNSDRFLYKNAPTPEQIGYQPKVSLHDAYPISIQNISSIQEVEKSAKDMASNKSRNYRPDSRRFRGNVYVSGPTAFAESHLLRMAIQTRAQPPSDDPPLPLLFSMPCRIPRCQMPNNDPLTGTKDREVFQPLSFLNQNKRIDPGAKTGCLGMTAVPFSESVGKKLHVGDEVLFYKHGEHLYNKYPAKEEQTPTF
jgi:uncharacterized protein YcbX